MTTTTTITNQIYDEKMSSIYKHKNDLICNLEFSRLQEPTHSIYIEILENNLG